MNNFIPFLRTTIGKKMIVGISGVVLSVFVLVHMAGNLLLFVSAEAYNHYSHKLISTPIIYVAEAGMLLFFLLHIGITAQLTLRNRDARSIGYEASAEGDKHTSWISRTLIYSGLLVLVFTVLHLITFKWGTYYTITYDNVEMRDMYRLVVEKFKEPTYVAWYVFSLVVLGLHLSHGVGSTLQSLGLASARAARLRKFSVGFAVLVAGGFIAQPIYLYFFGA